MRSIRHIELKCHFHRELAGVASALCELIPPNRNPRVLIELGQLSRRQVSRATSTLRRRNAEETLV